MKEEERKKLLHMIAMNVVRADHLMAAVEEAAQDDNAGAIVIPVDQARSVARALGTLAMAFSNTNLFTQEEIEEAVLRQEKGSHAGNLAVQLLMQGADEEIVRLGIMTVIEDPEHVEKVLSAAQQMYKHIKEEHPELLDEDSLAERQLHRLMDAIHSGQKLPTRH